VKSSAIRQLAQTQPLPSLQAAEQALLHGRRPAFDVEGEDAGEQLTHVLAAIFVLEHMAGHGATLPAALRVFFQKVRESVS
jgi:hypothetical protein